MQQGVRSFDMEEAKVGGKVEERQKEEEGNKFRGVDGEEGHPAIATYVWVQYIQTPFQDSDS